MRGDALTRHTGDREDDSSAVFSEHYPNGSIESVAVREIPPDVRKIFEHRSALYVHPDEYHPEDFSALQRVTHDHGERSYVAHRREKTYPRSGRIELETYVVDVDAEGTIISYGELRKHVADEHPEEIDRPQVGWTETARKYQRHGYGLRRLRMMNAVAHMRYGLPLYSDPVIEPAAKRRWEELVQLGSARQFRVGGAAQGYDRYVFTM